MNAPARRHLVAPTSIDAPPRDPPAGLDVRAPAPAEREALAALMLEAYRGTIDFDGSETIEVALDEVAGYLSGASGPPLLEHSLVAVAGGSIVGAVLVSFFEGLPLFAYAYTAPEWKGRGVSTALLRRSMASLAAAGFERVALFVTAGNDPAERIYERLGFRDAGDTRA
jgi:ribosomal protein S18 acetylase RimI-like enzyme